MARTRPQIPGIASSAHPSSTARGSVGQDVYQRLRTAVLDCTFTPGMALSEQSVSDEMGVSRAPVREAFRQLVSEGLLEVMPQRGTFVARLNRGQIADAIFVREAIECRAAELAARAPLAQRKALLEIVERQAQASAQSQYGVHLSSDEELHHQILVLAGHPHAWGPLRLARTGMNRIRHLAIPEIGSHQIALQEHRQLVRAIVRGDPAKAVELMRKHIRSPLNFLEQIARNAPDLFTEAPAATPKPDLSI